MYPDTLICPQFKSCAVAVYWTRLRLGTRTLPGPDAVVGLRLLKHTAGPLVARAEKNAENKPYFIRIICGYYFVMRRINITLDA